MKISILNSTLSCITKCIGFSLRVINKKIIFGLFLAGFLGACGAPTAMLGPAYTLTSTGSVAQAGLSYGSNHLIMSYTGKTPVENIEEIASKNLSVRKNIQKQTLESDDFFSLVDARIKKTSAILKLTNQ